MLFWHSEYRTIKIKDHWSISHVLIEIGVSDWKVDLKKLRLVFNNQTSISYTLEI